MQLYGEQWGLYGESPIRGSGLAKHIPYLLTRTLPVAKQIWNMLRQPVHPCNADIDLVATADCVSPVRVKKRFNQ
jgi:hypothetical protein